LKSLKVILKEKSLLASLTCHTVYKHSYTYPYRP